MFYMRIVTLKDMMVMKEGIRFIDYVDRNSDYTVYLWHLMTHLVYPLSAFF